MGLDFCTKPRKFLVVVGRLRGSLFFATGSRGGVADMLDNVEDSNVSIAKVCKRALPDNGELEGVEGLSPSTDEATDIDDLLFGDPIMPPSWEEDLHREVMLQYPHLYTPHTFEGETSELHSIESPSRWESESDDGLLT